MLAYVGGVKRRMIRKSDGAKARRKAVSWSKSKLSKSPKASPADESSVRAERSTPQQDETHEAAIACRMPRSQLTGQQTPFECLRSFDTSFLLGLIAGEGEE